MLYFSLFFIFILDNTFPHSLFEIWKKWRSPQKFIPEGQLKNNIK